MTNCMVFHSEGLVSAVACPWGNGLSVDMVIANGLRLLDFPSY